MKPFLGIDLTTDKKNEQFNGTEFLVIKPSSAMTQSFEQSSKKQKKRSNDQNSLSHCELRN